VRFYGGVRKTPLAGLMSTTVAAATHVAGVAQAALLFRLQREGIPDAAVARIRPTISHNRRLESFLLTELIHAPISLRNGWPKTEMPIAAGLSFQETAEAPARTLHESACYLVQRRR